MEISVSLVKSRFPNFGIRSTISETMDFVAKSRFVSLYEYFANCIRITSVTDVKKNSPYTGTYSYSFIPVNTSKY